MKKLLIFAAIIVYLITSASPVFAADSKPVTGNQLLVEKLDQMKLDDGIMDISESRAGKVILNASRLIATIFFIYELIKRYLKTSLGQERMNTGQLITRMIVVVVAFGLYSHAFEGLYNLIDTAVNAIRGGDYYERITNYHSYTINAILESQYTNEAGTISIWKLMTNPLKTVSDVIGLAVWNAAANLVAFIAQGCYAFIELYRYVWLLFLKLIGPLALATLITEDAKRIGIGWIENLVNVLLWPLWATIIMEIQMNLYAISSESASTGLINEFKWAIILNSITIFLILSIPGLLPRIARGAGIKAG